MIWAIAIAVGVLLWEGHNKAQAQAAAAQAAQQTAVGNQYVRSPMKLGGPHVAPPFWASGTGRPGAGAGPAASTDSSTADATGGLFTG